MRVGLALGVMWLALEPVASLADSTGNKLKNIFQSVAALGSGARTGLTENFEKPVTARWTVVQAGQSLQTASNVWLIESGSVDVVNARAMPSTVAYDGNQLIDLAGSPGPGVMSTSFATKAGKTYAVTIHYARNNGLGANVARATVQVLGQGSLLLADLQHDPGQIAFNQQQTYTGTFVADGTRATLRLSSLNSGNAGLTVDAITIAETKDQPTAAPVAAVAIGQPEDKAAFSTRCKRETLAQAPTATAQVDSICSSRWDMVVATAPITDAILALAPAPGASFNPASAAGRLTTVRWAAMPVTGQLKSGRLRDLDVGIISTPVSGATFSWFKNGEPIPFDVEEALKVRGATLSLIGCLSFGAAEGSRVYQVNTPGKAPFVLHVDFRSAAVASQSSDYGVTAGYGGQPPTLAALRKDGSEWTATCPQ